MSIVIAHSSSGLLLFSVFSAPPAIFSFSTLVGLVGSFLKKLSNSLFMASLRSTISAAYPPCLEAFTGLSQADGKALELATPIIDEAAPTAKFCYEVLFELFPKPFSFTCVLLFSIFSIYPN